MKFNTPRGPGFLEMRIQVHIQVNLQKTCYTLRQPACIHCIACVFRRLGLMIEQVLCAAPLGFVPFQISLHISLFFRIELFLFPLNLANFLAYILNTPIVLVLSSLVCLIIVVWIIYIVTISNLIFSDYHPLFLCS